MSDFSGLPAQEAASEDTDQLAVDMGERSHLDAQGRPRIIERRFSVCDEDAGYRLDRYLAKKIPRLSRNRIQRIIRSQLWRNGEPAPKPSTLVRAGDELVMRREAQPEPACPRTFKVLYSDPRLMVVDKPAGLPVHASAKYYFNTLARVLSEHFPGEMAQICHRLDRETSGCLIVARDRDAARHLKKSFETRRVEKIYQAVVYGRPAHQRISLPLALLTGKGELGIRMSVCADGLPSETDVRPLRHGPHYSLVECRPITGRQHQIRAHLAAIDHPILGDKLYAHSDADFAAFCDHGLTPELAERFVIRRQALHAAAISFPHPDTGDRIRINGDFPEELAALVSSDTQ